MGALQHVDTPDYAALLFRRTFRDLALPGALMDRAHDWLGPTAARWDDQEHTWYFPSGASITFGYLDHENDKYRYQGAAATYVAFDELTQFTESQYRYLFSRMRRSAGSDLPLRMRAASNPGGVGHDWVRQRFLEERRWFVPALLDDNPYLDADEYRVSLDELDPYTRAQLLHGDWFAKPPGSKFQRQWFKVEDSFPADARRARYWDLAATEPKPGNDPDWTAGALLGEKDGIFYVLDIKRKRMNPAGVEALILQTAELDGKRVPVFMEQEPGAAGVGAIDHYARRILKGFTFRGVKTTGPKEVRANPVSAAAANGNVRLVRGAWISDFLDEAESFPGGAHDDQVDAVSGAFERLSARAREGYTVTW